MINPGGSYDELERGKTEIEIARNTVMIQFFSNNFIVISSADHMR
jgi:hypothetical protein